MTRETSQIQEGRHRLSVADLLAALVVVIVFQPFVANVPWGKLIDTATFGNIMPLSDTARMLVLLKTTLGLFNLAILVSRLVGAYSSDLPSDVSSDYLTHGSRPPILRTDRYHKGWHRKTPVILFSFWFFSTAFCGRYMK